MLGTGNSEQEIPRLVLNKWKGGTERGGRFKRGLWTVTNVARAATNMVSPELSSLSNEIP